MSKGVFRESELTEALMAPGKIPGSSGTRNLSDNLSDLKAQIAANNKVPLNKKSAIKIVTWGSSDGGTKYPTWEKYICKIYVKVCKIYFFQKLYI